MTFTPPRRACGRGRHAPRDRGVRRHRRRHAPRRGPARGDPRRRRRQHSPAADALGHRPGRPPRRARHPASSSTARTWARICRITSSRGSHPPPTAERCTAPAAIGELARYLTTRRGMLTSNVAEAYGFVRTEVADRTGMAARSSRHRDPLRVRSVRRRGAHPDPRRRRDGGGDPPAAAQSRHDPASLGRPGRQARDRSEVSQRSRTASTGRRCWRASRSASASIATEALRAVTTGGWVCPRAART